MSQVLFINPGTGSAHSYGRVTISSARANMRQLVKDAGVPTAHVSDGKSCEESSGRFEFTVRYGDRDVAVLMPGLRLDKVRYMDREKQNIWHFPRLYVDGNSWVWLYAIGSVRSALTGEEEP